MMIASSGFRYNWRIKNFSSGNTDIVSSSIDPSVFIFGLGYVGIAIAKSLLADGISVSGTCTSIPKVAQCRFDNKGLEAYLLDSSGPMIEPAALQALDKASAVLITIPPDPSQPSDVIPDPVLQHHKHDLLRSALRGDLKWVGYLSSTGVYGDCNGQWINEQTQLNPNSKKTITRSVVDKAWLNTRLSMPLTHNNLLILIYNNNHINSGAYQNCQLA